MGLKANTFMFAPHITMNHIDYHIEIVDHFETRPFSSQLVMDSITRKSMFSTDLIMDRLRCGGKRKKYHIIDTLVVYRSLNTNSLGEMQLFFNVMVWSSMVILIFDLLTIQ